MAQLSPFLIGGTCYSGTTLLTLLLNGDGVVCLDEPDFAKPDQVQRNIPLLRQLFPDLVFPDPPGCALAPADELALIRACAEVLEPTVLGVKTCGPAFVEMAGQYRTAGHRVAAIFRDPRDVLMRRLPPWLSEDALLAHCRMVWNDRERFDGWVRYEDLVSSPRRALGRVVDALGLDIDPRVDWDPTVVPGVMLKNERHDALTSGRIGGDRVGLWRRRGLTPSADAQATAVAMGYPP